MTRTVYTDKLGNDLDIYVNDHGKLFISAGDPDNELYNGFVCLGKSDAEHLLKNLSDILDNYDLSDD